jgi:transcriptional regulator
MGLGGTVVTPRDTPEATSAQVLLDLSVVGRRRDLVLQARRLGITQQHIADLAKITTKTIRAWERGGK